MSLRRKRILMVDHLSERDDLTLRTLAFIERTTVAEIVRLMLASRRSARTAVAT